MPARVDPPALRDWERPFAAVREQAQRRGLRALVVGGYVRDRLLGGEREKQIHEVDILVEGQGAIELATSDTTRPAESRTSAPGRCETTSCGGTSPSTRC
jgi:hypothetical protein